MFKSKVKLLAVMACCSVLLLCSTIVFALGTQNFSGNVNITYTAPPPSDDLWNANKKIFYKVNLNKLLQQISNNASSSTTNMSKVNSLATAKTTAGQMRAFTVGKSSGADISVVLGGLTWTAAYLSRAKGTTESNGDVILTLWLTAFTSNNIDFSHFASGTWSVYNGLAAPSKEYFPNSMYGASYIRAVGLNNGGIYATSLTKTSKYTPSSTRKFAMFTMASNGLADYIVTPRQVTWQEYGQNQMHWGDDEYSKANENWSNEIPDEGIFMGETYQFCCAHYNTSSLYPDGQYHYYFNFATINYNDNWADDKVWLPSAYETGYDNSHIGLWDLSADQRRGLNSTYCWTRTESRERILVLDPSGNNAYYNDPFRNFGNSSRDNMAVRPALHLNLTKAAQAAV